MRIIAKEIGYFEDYVSDEVLEVGIAGVDRDGVARTFSIQRSTYGPDDQDVRNGMDSYSIGTERGLSVYGCLRRLVLSEQVLGLEFVADDAEILGVSSVVEIDLREVLGQGRPDLPQRIRDVVDWGDPSKRPELVGL